jgi:hypothetical protein
LEGLAKRDLLPTPTAADSRGSGAAGYSTASGRHAGVTPTDALVAAGGDSKKRLNPAFVEWMMGWPIGWTDCERAATESFRSWLQRLSCASPASSG